MRQVHIHIHRAPTRDSGFDESKHPRASDGKFGSGGGTSKEGDGKGSGGGKGSAPSGGAPKAKKGEVHFKEAKDKQGRTVYKLYDKGGEAGTVASKREAEQWWADHGGKKAEAAHDRGESGMRS